MPKGIIKCRIGFINPVTVLSPLNTHYPLVHDLEKMLLEVIPLQRANKKVHLGVIFSILYSLASPY